MAVMFSSILFLVMRIEVCIETFFVTADQSYKRYFNMKEKGMILFGHLSSEFCSLTIDKMRNYTFMLTLLVNG
jgi:hypothetical protein